MTQVEYAAHRGVGQSSVSRAVSGGRITTVEKDGKTLIDSAAADREWAATSRPYVKSDGSNSPPLGGGWAEQNLYDLQASRAKREHHEAGIAEMKERKLAGELIERRAARAGVIDVAAELRTQLDQVGSRIADRLAEQKDAGRCRELVNAEIREALVDAVKSLRGMSGRAAAVELNNDR